MNRDQNPKTLTLAQKELVADLLKERIYATLALLAVLITIDPDHYTPGKAELLIVGTIFSLWAASLVATLVARRAVFQGELDPETEREHQMRKHSPMLGALVFPSIMIGLSALGLIGLGLALKISVISTVILLVSWSLMSARALKAKRMPVIVAIAFELAIGAGVVALKVVLDH